MFLYLVFTYCNFFNTPLPFLFYPLFYSSPLFVLLFSTLLLFLLSFYFFLFVFIFLIFDLTPNLVSFSSFFYRFISSSSYCFYFSIFPISSFRTLLPFRLFVNFSILFFPFFIFISASIFFNAFFLTFRCFHSFLAIFFLLL